MHFSHLHPLYRNNNNTFYGILEEAVCGILYEAFIKPFQGTRGRRAEYLALMAHRAGEYKWVVILRYAKSYVSLRKCNVTTSHTFQSHIEQYSTAYVKI